MIKDLYESKIARPQEKLLSKNRVDITYYTNDMSHKLRIEMDSHWRILEDKDDHLSPNPVSNLLHKFRYVIDLNSNPITFRKHNFIQIIQRLPLINYLTSFENIVSPSVLTQVKDVKFVVYMDG